MYNTLRVNIVLTIVSFQCLMLSSSTETFVRDQTARKRSGPDDCVLRLPEHLSHVAPRAHRIVEKERIDVLPDADGTLYVEHGAEFVLNCAPRRFALDYLPKLGEVTVTCLGGNALEFRRQNFTYDDFACHEFLPASRYVRADEIFNPVQPETPQPKRNIRLEAIQKLGVPGCFIWLTDANKNTPVLLNTSVEPNVMIRPDRHGLVVFEPGQTFGMACVDSQFTSPLMAYGVHEISVKCAQGTHIRYERRKYEFTKYQCSSTPNAIIRSTRVACQRPAFQVLEVGFQTGHWFLPSYKICFNLWDRITLMAWYVVKTPLYNERQIPSRPPKYGSSKFYGDINVPLKYENQTLILTEILKSPKVANWYIEKPKRYLIPGHLMDGKNFYFAYEQHAAYFYENTVPQWYIFNEGVWQGLERLVTKWLEAENGKKYAVVSGTYGKTMFHDYAHKYYPILLAPPMSLGVPLYVWKMLYDVDAGNGTVFIGLNDPYKKIDKDVYICHPIECPGKMRRKVFSTILLFCCTHKEFEKVFGEFDPVLFREF